jgi:hypothetical protein
MSAEFPRAITENPRPEYVESLTSADMVDESLPKPIADLLDRDYPLANIKRSDREYARLLAENVRIYTSELFPPRESIYQGLTGAALMEDPEFDRVALTDDQKLRLQTALLDHFIRSSRGLNGWQQDKLSETINTNRVEDNREKDESRGGLSGLFR